MDHIIKLHKSFSLRMSEKQRKKILLINNYEFFSIFLVFLCVKHFIEAIVYVINIFVARVKRGRINIFFFVDVFYLPFVLILR